METKGKNRKLKARGIPVSRDAKKKIKQLRINKGYSVDELASISGIHKRTIKKLESISDTQKNYDELSLQQISKALGVDQIFLTAKSNQKSIAGFVDHCGDFGYLIEKFREVDQNLLIAIRDHKHAPEKIIEQQYNDCMFMRLAERDLTLKQIYKSISSTTYKQSLLHNLPKPGLTIEVSEGFRKITYICSSGERLTVNSPELLWDCHCDTPTAKKNNFKCPIHSKPNAEIIHAAIKSDHVLIKYDGLEFFWKNTHNLWPPSIDSFYMFDVMKEDGLLTKNYSSVLDIGSGTGFLGIAAAMKNRSINRLGLSDWLLEPYLYGTINWLNNGSNKDYVNFKPSVGLFANEIDSMDWPYDVGICNPPYLPLLDGHDDLGMESTIAGTNLIDNVITKSKLLAKKLYIQFSNIANDEANVAAAKAGVQLKPIGKSKLVPFRLRVLWKRPDYLAKLIEDRRLIEDNGSRCRFWHRIQTYVIE